MLPGRKLHGLGFANLQDPGREKYLHLSNSEFHCDSADLALVLVFGCRLMKKTGGSNLDLDENIRETNGQKLTQQKMAQMSKKNREKGSKHKRQ